MYDHDNNLASNFEDDAVRERWARGESEPRFIPGARNSFNVPMTECIRCGLACAPSDDFCICGGRTFNYVKNVLWRDVS